MTHRKPKIGSAPLPFAFLRLSILAQTGTKKLPAWALRRLRPNTHAKFGTGTAVSFQGMANYPWYPNTIS
jgi:hypothetical protein